jgi:hypothetical protein
MPRMSSRLRAAASSTVAVEVAATATGGLGLLAGRGTTGTSRKRKKPPGSPSAATLPRSSQARRRSRDSSKPCSKRGGTEDLQVDPRTAPAHAEVKAAARKVIQEGGFLRQGNGVAVGQHAHRRADCDPARSAEDVAGQGNGGGADPEEMK